MIWLTHIPNVENIVEDIQNSADGIEQIYETTLAMEIDAEVEIVCSNTREGKLNRLQCIRLHIKFLKILQIFLLIQ